jgi:hypothetical protein
VRLADGATQAGLLPPRRASHSRKRTDLVVELLVLIEPVVLRDLEDGDRLSEYSGDSNFDG